MCGIAGYIAKKGSLDITSIEKMIKIIKHRGPDDEGIELLHMFHSDKPNIALGFVRLSIRDLSMNGHQPMFNGDRSIVIAFNGEIYNANEIRQELQSKNMKFHSSSDTEVILHSYEMYGIDKTLECLNGMFAIVICDMKKDCVYFVRDRVGEKPLYYYDSDSTFMFSSEYKAFYTHPDFIPELNADALDEYFLYRYVSDNETLLKNVYIVRPGHYLQMNQNGITEKKYYEIPVASNIKSKVGLCEFEGVLRKSIRSRLVSDIEVGVQLSGGIDSSMVLLWANNDQKDIKTFSMVFDNPEYTEEKYIDKALSIAGGKGYKYKMDPQDFKNDLYDSTWHFEAPMNHHGSVQLFHLCRLAQKEVNVILTGEGADELMGGYGWYPISMHYDHKKAVWKLRKFFHKLKGVQEKHWTDQDNYTDLEKFLLYDTQTSPDVIKNMTCNLDYNKVLKKRKKILESCNGESVERKLNYEMKTFMVDLLLRQDKVSMASSIECRVPFVDQDLIDYVRNNISVKNMIKRQRFGTKQQNTKLILKRLAGKHFGSEFANRTKMGLPSPLEEYFYEDTFFQYMNEEILPGIKARGFFNYAFIEKCYSEKKNLQSVVWRAVAFEVWAQMYIDRKGIGVLEYAGL